ncbi:hypothetical protein A2704_01025 [Candidatus Kaiserbacteria bacterium RIFCSPHIGHO2_01_FULL_54_36b]|uniref:Uncharacterized protein n=1 Tax=Candidatus Kaiserbacteria bacterium RIFCSPHIGHO2_01_FULL_54_36b TaxID=1798483 RepID=A0A1F6CL16_9BACT|nr:MAG: hypothetical protein A2704_01025 [Candidatus Kaiserbacteria bacterium RIFCSPHIGHO2_01_FULL_54_36b]
MKNIYSKIIFGPKEDIEMAKKMSKKTRRCACTHRCCQCRGEIREEKIITKNECGYQYAFIRRTCTKGGWIGDEVIQNYFIPPSSRGFGKGMMHFGI